ncbi:sulfotransferase [Chloroflexota bacterium]
MALERPIFVVGVHRSGTTLLRFMLNSHPRIYIPPESDFIPRFFGRDPGGELSEKRIACLLDTIFGSYRFSKEWRDTPPRLDTFLQAMANRSPADFLETLYGLYAQQNAALRWGDKTPIYASYVDLIHQILPHAQFIHIIRDGRDAALSMLEKWGQREFHVDIYFAARNWVRRIRQAQASAEDLEPDQFYELRYEYLVAHPEPALRSLCEFLDEPYHPDMARHQLLGREQIPSGDFHDAVRKPPSTARIGRWQNEMSSRDQRLFQRVAGSLLTELGYEVQDPGSMPAGELARLSALAAKYESLQTGRRVLQSIGVVPPI